MLTSGMFARTYAVVRLILLGVGGIACAPRGLSSGADVVVPSPTPEPAVSLDSSLLMSRAGLALRLAEGESVRLRELASHPFATTHAWVAQRTPLKAFSHDSRPRAVLALLSSDSLVLAASIGQMSTVWPLLRRVNSTPESFPATVEWMLSALEGPEAIILRMSPADSVKLSPLTSATAFAELSPPRVTPTQGSTKLELFVRLDGALWKLSAERRSDTEVEASLRLVEVFRGRMP